MEVCLEQSKKNLRSFKLIGLRYDCFCDLKISSNKMFILFDLKSMGVLKYLSNDVLSSVRIENTIKFSTSSNTNDIVDQKDITTFEVDENQIQLSIIIRATNKKAWDNQIDISIKPLGFECANPQMEISAEHNNYVLFENSTPLVFQGIKLFDLNNTMINGRCDAHYYTSLYIRRFFGKLICKIIKAENEFILDIGVLYAKVQGTPSVDGSLAWFKPVRKVIRIGKVYMGQPDNDTMEVILTVHNVELTILLEIHEVFKFDNVNKLFKVEIEPGNAKWGKTVYHKGGFNLSLKSNSTIIDDVPIHVATKWRKTLDFEFLEYV